jgi:AcrR family transcriptional regulator
MANRASAPATGGNSGRGSRGPARRDEEVLAAATKVFHNRGYADASVQDIADELGILKGSLYHYIDTKEDLLYRVLERSHLEVQAILDEVVALSDDTPPLERLRAYIVRQVEYTARHLAPMAVYYHDVDQLSPARRKELLSKRRVHDKFVAGMIEEAKRRGEVDRSVDANLVTKFVFGAMIWAYRWYKPRGTLKAAEVAESCADFVLHGLTGKR